MDDKAAHIASFKPVADCLRDFFDVIDSETRENLKATEINAYYDRVFKIATQRNEYPEGERWLLGQFIEIIREYLGNTASKRLSAAQSQSDSLFLQTYIKVWKNLLSYLRSAVIIFSYLDNYLCQNDASLSERGVEDFVDIIYQPFSQPLMRSFIRLVDNDRHGQTVDYSIMRSFSDALVELGQNQRSTKGDLTKILFHYHTLENEFLQQIRIAYNQSGQWVESMTPKDFVTKISDIYRIEIDRIQHYLQDVSIVPLRHCLHDVLLKGHLQQLLSKPNAINFFFTLANSQYTKVLYDLIADYPQTVDVLCKQFQAYVFGVGKKVIQTFMIQRQQYQQMRQQQQQQQQQPPQQPTMAPPDPLTLVSSILEYNQTFQAVIEHGCNSSPALQEALRKGMETFINEEDTFISQSLALYLQSVLSTKGRHTHASPLDMIRHIAAVFGYIRNKDVFELEYQKHLCQRLLSGESWGEGIESEALTELKHVAGYEFTSKAETMLRDMDTSKQITTSFKAKNAELLADLGFDTDVSVCTSGGWLLPPTSYTARYTARENLTTGPSDIPNTSGKLNDVSKLPSSMTRLLNEFGGFYCSKNPNRVLTYRLEEGACEVTFVPNPTEKPDVTKLLVVTPVMYMILEQLSSVPRFITWGELCRNIDLDPHLVSSHLLPLCLPLNDPKKCIVRKSTPVPTFKEDDKLMLNKNYENPLVKIHIPFIRRITEQEKTKEQIHLEKVRTIMLDGVIVRYLKMRKECSHLELINEVTNQVKNRFIPDRNLIKACIERLIADMIIERAEDDRNVYRYMA